MSRQSMRTPLGKVRGHGSGSGGTTHFWHERLTGIALLPLTVVFVGVVIALWGASYAEAVALLSNPVVAVLMIAAAAVTAWHMQLGMKVIIEDYVHEETRKILALLANTFFSALVGLAAVFALLKIAFGG